MGLFVGLFVGSFVGLFKWIGSFVTGHLAQLHKRGPELGQDHPQAAGKWHRRVRCWGAQGPLQAGRADQGPEAVAHQHAGDLAEAGQVVDVDVGHR